MDLFKQTPHLTRTYNAANPNISKRMRTQGNDLKQKSVFDPTMLKIKKKGESSFVCWAFSCATMIRAECRRLIKYLYDNGKVNKENKQECLQFINREDVHMQIRNLIMCILLPKKLHIDGKHQAAFLRAAVSRVRNISFVKT